MGPKGVLIFHFSIELIDQSNKCFLYAGDMTNKGHFLGAKWGSKVVIIHKAFIIIKSNMQLICTSPSHKGSLINFKYVQLDSPRPQSPKTFCGFGL